MRHLQFSKGVYMFLEDLKKAEALPEDVEFSYKFDDNLKIHRDQPEKHLVGSSFEEQILSEQRHKAKRESIENFKRIEEQIMQNKRGGNFNQMTFGNAGAPQGDAIGRMPTEIDEELDERDDDGVFDDEMDESESKAIESLREEEYNKLKMVKEEDRLQSYLKQRKQLEKSLEDKEQKIKEITHFIDSSEGMEKQQVLAISHNPDDEQYNEEFQPSKISRADFIMAQVNLEVIESHGSQELQMSTQQVHLRKLQQNPLSDKASLNSRHTTSLIHDNYDVVSSTQTRKPPKHSQTSRKTYSPKNDTLTRDQIKMAIAEQFRVFSERYDFSYDMILADPQAMQPFPSEADVYEYCRYVTQQCKMENEIPIICLVYLERLIMKTGILLNIDNLGSKVWDDDSLENVHFPKVMSDVSLKMINMLEQTFLEFIDFDLVVKGSEYAKYYFILRSLSEELKQETPHIFKAKIASESISQPSQVPWGEFPLQAPISADKMQELQRNSAKAEILLKEKQDKEYLMAVKNRVQLDKTL
ncbi:hypothetical protein FGO68_gene8318 [Halteria grandinella]|uniref:Uncharacterized protein n=1 Tax=Halteria grandinella TaxID=5974 RepID=A0A8J8P153_HALGN|nr:hypothetical protein FGO68_gene8318 [Halteria grandinella]